MALAEGECAVVLQDVEKDPPCMDPYIYKVVTISTVVLFFAVVTVVVCTYAIVYTQ